MTRKFLSSITSFVLAGLTALAPVAPVFGANEPVPAATATDPSSAQATPAQTAPQNPPATPPVMQNFTVSVGPDYTRPKPAWPNLLLPYTPITLAPPQYTNGPRIQQLIHNGKLQLSMEEAIELALQNNPDIAVQRYNSWIAETDILRTKAGGAQRGAGGAVTTATAAGDVPTLTYDPTLTINSSLDDRVFPANNPLTSGVGTNATTAQSLSTHTATGNFIYSQAFHTGTSFSVTVDNTRSTTSSSSVFFNPLVQSTGQLLATQPLLNGFGTYVNERYIKIAIITKKAVDYAFQQSLLTDITTVENDYWELVFARGNVVVQQQAVTEAQALYDDNQKQVQVGTLAPLEVVRAEAQLATAQQQLILAQTAQLQDQIVLMSVITKDPNAPELQNVEIVPTDATQTPPPMEDIALTDAVKEAVANRPDVIDSRINLDADAINVKVARNGLLPTLNLSGYITYAGIGGNNKITGTPTVGPGTTIDGPGDVAVTVANLSNGGLPTTLIVPNTITPVIGVKTGGLGGDLSSLLHGKYPEYEAQITLTVPIRNRVAQADSTRAILTAQQDRAKYQQVINSVTVDVHNAQIELQQDRAGVIAAQKAYELQKETLDSDQKKLDLGAATIFIIVTDQQNLAAAGSAEVRAEVNLVEAQVNFERAMGRTLAAKHVTIANAKMGTVPHDNLIPGTTAEGEIIGLKEALASIPNGR